VNTMNCETARQLLLDLNIDEARRHEAYLALRHLEDCQNCQAAMREYDRISTAMDSSKDVAIPNGGWERFEQRLAANVMRPKKRRRLLPALAMAASLLLAFATFEIGRHHAAPPVVMDIVQSPDTGATEPTHFAPRDLPTDVSAFEQVSNVFDGRAGWVLVSNDASDVGISSGPIAAPRKVLLLRLSTSLGAKTSEADLMMIPGQTANLKVPFGGQMLHYRIGASKQEPTRLSVWLEVVTVAGGETVGALDTTLDVQPGQKFTAGQLVTSDGAYRLEIGFAESDLGMANP
jgi:hypothetical protein